MLESKLALQSSFIRNIFSKRRCKSAHDVCRDLNEQRHEEEALPTNTPRQTIVVYDDIKYRFREIRVQFRQRVRELGNVDSNKLVCVLYAIVERR